jgi:glycosyltransferase involved in cell wall biosynthesis
MPISQRFPTLSSYPAEPGALSLYGGQRSLRVGEPDSGRTLVSVVTVVRNGAGTFLRTARSVLAQSYPYVEYIVVDGGSTDGTLELIRSLDTRLALWVSEPDRGISDAFNKGIALSRGQIIGLLNSDDWYDADAILHATSVFATQNADIVYGNLQYWIGDQPSYLVRSDAGLLPSGMTVGHPTVFAHRACYERFGLFRLDYLQAMDYEWLLRAFLGGARFRYTKKCQAHMQTGGVGDRRWLRSQREVALARATHCPKFYPPIDYMRYFCWACFKGVARRMLDRLGMTVVRRWYHAHYSPLDVKCRDGP